ncbi:hypothetical protein [uncultured Microbacterium sp.]|uniref:hypothetical protein n=1 Tax=uncultured Microbacterium sp. TaxID=191216 RepID=UPI0026218ADA|nr:hypothetical protein [uncultured Microbacterium sp.]
MTIPAQTYPFDARPLTDPVDPRAVSAFWRGIRATHPTSTVTVIGWVIAGVFVVMTIMPLIGVAVFGIAGGGLAHGGISGGFVLPLVLVVLFLAIGIPIGVASMRRNRTNAFRIARFAQANAMTYEHEIANPALPGMIFQLGDSRVASQLVRGHTPRFVEFGNYRYSTGSGKNRSTHHWGYVAVKLDVPLPNIVLDALGNNTLGTNLPASFSRDQRLSLEGDFDQHFTLYCPQGYEADALYLFTPDIMARFIDNAAQLDVEIVDDWMFLYMRRAASTTDAATWAWLFNAVGALMTKFDQWARWRDDRLRAAQAQAPAPGMAESSASAPGPVGSPASAPLPFAAPAGLLAPPPGVALQGRRLHRSVPWLTIVIFAVVVGFMILPQFFGVLGVLFLR